MAESSGLSIDEAIKLGYNPEEEASLSKEEKLVLDAGEVDKTQKVIDQLNANGISDSSIIYLNHRLCKDVKQDLEYYDYCDGNQEFFRSHGDGTYEQYKPDWCEHAAIDLSLQFDEDDFVYVGIVSLID